ncbi:MAG: PQQ-binding-like beta-propeller repeat protein [Propionibacteriaceae bacterium]|nr:PQQ-binding-like beta-propeller repeat protein [Propionibacteriaceae bacterium]
MNRVAALAGARTVLLVAGSALTVYGAVLWWTDPLANTPAQATGVTLALPGVCAGWSLAVWGISARQRVLSKSVFAAGFVASAWLCGRYVMELADDGYTPDGILLVALGTLTLTTAATVDLMARAFDPDKTTPRALLHSRPALLGAGSALVALALVAVALAPLMPYTRITTADAGQDPYPDQSRHVTGEVAWTHTVESPVLDSAAGSRGPLVVLEDGVIALDSADGSVLWERRRSSVSQCQLGGDPVGLKQRPYIVTSPDGAHAVLLSGQCATRGRLEIVETATGRIVTGRDVTEPPAVQLTNQVALAGGEGISLTDGATLWYRDDDGNIDSGTAGLSHFIALPNCQEAVCPAEVFADTDPADTREIQYIRAQGGSKTPLASGWLVQPTTGTTPDSTSGPIAMQAYSIDTEETVPLGPFRFVYPASPTRLVLEDPEDTANVFDSATRTLTPTKASTLSVALDEDRAWPTNDVHKAEWVDGKLQLSTNKGPIPIPADLPATDSPTHKASAWAAPGCVMVEGTWLGTEAGGKANRYRTYLACVR